ncbi:MAG: hypothetical protein J1E05_02410 [Eubacterium sp.]|nr:hypothetical protein [Eubacterium sp.]
MTSTNSLNSNRFLPMFKNVFKRYAAFFLVVQIFSGLYAFFIPRFTLRSIAEMAEYMEAGYQEDLTASCIGSMSFFLFTTGTVWVFILAVSLFREIYSRRASVFYYSMPVKRGTYFNVNMLYGVITVLTAFVLVAALSIISVKTNSICAPEFYTFEPAQLVKVLLVALLSVIVAYATLMLFAVLSGRKWHYVVLGLVAGNLVYAVVINFIRYANVSIWGLNISYDKWWVLSTIAPFFKSFEAENVLSCVIVLTIQFVIIYLTGYFMFKKRKAETAESSLELNIITKIILILGLFAVVFSFLSIIDTPGYAKLGIAVAAVLAVSLIATARIRKKAFTKKSAKWLIGTVAAVIIIVSAVEFLPNIKYKNYVPAADEVESIVYDENVFQSEYGDVFSSIFNMMFSFDGYDIGIDGYTTFNFTSDESKAKVEALHKKLIEQTTIDNQYSDDYYYHGSYSVKITYNLKNGKTVERFYDVCTKDIYDEYIALMQTEEALNQTEPFNFKDEDILFIGVLDYRDDSEEQDYDEDYDPYIPSNCISLDEYGTLFDKVIKDRANEPRDMFNSFMFNTAFLLYDIDNHYRVEGDSDFDIEDFWEDEEELEFEEYYPDYRDASVVVYTYYKDVTDEMKAKLSAMTPEEILAYNTEYEMLNEGFLIMDNYIHINAETDDNTIAYLESLGLIKK